MLLLHRYFKDSAVETKENIRKDIVNAVINKRCGNLAAALESHPLGLSYLTKQDMIEIYQEVFSDSAHVINISVNCTS